MKTVAATVVFLAALAAPLSPALAQDPAPSAQVSELDEVVVLARRSGAPMWEIQRGDSTLLLVGAIGSAPRDVEWRPDALERATARADLVLYPQEGRVSIADLFRLIWRIRTIGSLPRGQTTADYLSPDWQARLEAVMASERSQDWRTASLLLTGIDLMRKAGFDRNGTDVADVVRRSARRARIDGRPVGTVRGDELVDSLIRAPQTAHVPCIQAAITAAEAGPGAAAQRARDWTAFRVREVLASPVDQALDRCWPWGDPEIAPQLRSQWHAASNSALVQPGVTLGIVPLRLLAEPGGVLDLLEAQGLEIVGPEWKDRPEDAEAL